MRPSLEYDHNSWINEKSIYTMYIQHLSFTIIFNAEIPLDGLKGTFLRKKVCKIIALNYSLGLNQGPPTYFYFLKSTLNKLRFFKLSILLNNMGFLFVLFFSDDFKKLKYDGGP
jgi:hypothetical protein